MDINQCDPLIKAYAKAKAEAKHLEHFRKVRLAQLKQEAATIYEDGKPLYKTVDERDNYARTHKDYIELLEGLREAVQVETASYWKLHMVELKIDVWRSKQAMKRAEMNLV